MRRRGATDSRFLTILSVFIILQGSFSFWMPSKALAQADDYFDFKGIALNSNISEINKESKYYCKDSPEPIADRICMLNRDHQETVAGVQIKFLLLGYYSDRLASIHISFHESHFRQVISAFSEKYGESVPTISLIKNRMGVSFENQEYKWLKKDSTLRIKRYVNDIETSTIDYRTLQYYDEFERRRKALNKKKSGDL